MYIDKFLLFVQYARPHSVSQFLDLKKVVDTQNNVTLLILKIESNCFSPAESYSQLRLFEINQIKTNSLVGLQSWTQNIVAKNVPGFL